MVMVLNRRGIDITTGYEFKLVREVCEYCFLKLKPLWPEIIDVTYKIVLTDEVVYSPELVEVTEDVEDSYGYFLRHSNFSGDTEVWGVVHWAIVQCLATRAKKLDTLHPRQLGFSEVEAQLMRGHLGWQGEMPEGVLENSTLVINEDTGKILSIQNAR